ncbi:MAG: anthranilate phosphoribosyltransferase [Terrimicrobiaceae bacterium]|nr:anthranilate phosphoribosyltransferase [Terrimicrobiaceae bacterium]
MEGLLEKLRARVDLTGSDVAALCAMLLDEARTVEERAGLLRALTAKGETPAELACFVRTLLARARKIEIPASGAPLMDVCGTGGDRQGLFNISTAVMFVVAACGVRVAKHGNRGITSKSGGADVLEACGVRIELDPAQAAKVLDQAGCVFLFAPLYHPAFKAIAPVRKFLAEQGQATVFNKLGPLLNPANPPYQLAGVFDPAMVATYGAVFAELGRTRAWAVHGRAPRGVGREPEGVDRQPGAGLDEMSTLGVTEVHSVDGLSRASFTLDAAEFGIRKPAIEELLGGSAAENAVRLDSLLRGRAEGAIADMVAWNAAGALVVAGACADVGSGLDRAREAIRSGEAAARLDALRAATRAA